MLMLGAILMIGCDGDEAIRVYDAPPDEHEHEHEHAATAPQPPTAAGGSGMVRPITWQAPAGWQIQPASGSATRFATFLIGPADDPIDLTVVALPATNMSRSVLANVNRWLDQMGRERLEDVAQFDRYIKPIELPGLRALLVEIAGPPLDDEEEDGDPEQLMLAAIIQGPRLVWFVKSVGPYPVLAAERQRFASFVRSIRFPATTPTKPPISESSDVVTIRYQVPDHWHKDPQQRPMRLVTFIVEDGSRRADMWISRFAGSVGSPLMNINRWRRQVGLPGIDDLGQQATEDISAGDTTGSMLDLAGPKDAAGRASRLLIALFNTGNTKWFFRMHGDDQLVAREKETFVQFIGRVQFVEPSRE